MPINRNEIRMGGRYQRRTETNEDNTGARGTLALDTRSVNLKFYKFGEVKKYYDVNILPFRVGRNNPAVVAGELREGDWDYSVDYFVHKNVGPDKGTYICPKKTYGKACPMCEEAQRLSDENGSDAAKGMWASKRSLLCVQPLDERGRGDVVPMLLDCAYNNFTHDLTDASTACMRGDGVVDFANPGAAGREVSFQIGEESMGGGRKYKIAKNFAFNKRREEIPDSVLDAVPCLDSLLVVSTKEDIETAMFGGPSNDNRDNDNRSGRDQERGGRDYDRNEDRREYYEDQRRERETARDQERGGRDYERGQSRRDDEQPSRGSDREERSPRDEQPQERTLRGSDGRDFQDPFPDQPTNLERGGRDQERPQETRPQETSTEEKCPHGYCFGTDCDRKSMCPDCPDSIYGRCKRASGR